MSEIDKRPEKAKKIIEEYMKRETQQGVGNKFGMSEKEVRKVTQEFNFKHTRRVTPENRRPEETINPFAHYNKLDFLDNYPLENFKKKQEE